MAISIKALTAALGDTIDDAAIEAVRAALVAFDHGELNTSACLAACDSALEGFGIEAIQNDEGRTLARYVNLGETYTTTILYSGRFMLTSWGGWYERTPEYRANSNRQWREQA
jgi:hypothetical protein